MGIASTPSLGLSTNANGGLVGPVPFWDEGRNVPSPQPGSVVTGADGAKYILAKATGVIPPNTNVVLTEPAMTVAAGAGDWYSQTTAIPINNYAWFRASIQGGGVTPIIPGTPDGPEEAVISPAVTSERALYSFSGQTLLIDRPASMTDGDGPYWPWEYKLPSAAYPDRRVIEFSTDHALGDGGLWYQICVGDPSIPGNIKDLADAIAAGWLDDIPNKPAANPAFVWPVSGKQMETPRTYKWGDTWVKTAQVESAPRADGLPTRGQATVRLLSTDGINFTTDGFRILNIPAGAIPGNGSTSYCTGLAPNPFPQLINPATGQPWVAMCFALAGDGSQPTISMWGCDNPITDIPTLICGLPKIGGRAAIGGAQGDRFTFSLTNLDLSSARPVRQGIAIATTARRRGSGVAYTPGDGYEIVMSLDGKRIIRKPILNLARGLSGAFDGGEIALPVIRTFGNKRIAIYNAADTSNKKRIGVATGPLRNPLNMWADPLDPPYPATFDEAVLDFTTLSAIPAGWTEVVVGSPTKSFGPQGLTITLPEGSEYYLFGPPINPAATDVADIVAIDLITTSATANRAPMVGFADAAVRFSSMVDALTLGTGIASTLSYGALVNGAQPIAAVESAYTSVGIDATSDRTSGALKTIGARWFPRAKRSYVLTLSQNESEEMETATDRHATAMRTDRLYRPFFGLRSIGSGVTVERVGKLVLRENDAANGVLVPQTLTLSNTTPVEDTSWSATINGISAGSTVTATSSDGTVMTVANGVVSGTFANPGAPTLTLTEANPGFASNGVTNIVLDVKAVGQPVVVQTFTQSVSGTDSKTRTIPSASIGTPHATRKITAMLELRAADVVTFQSATMTPDSGSPVAMTLIGEINRMETAASSSVIFALECDAPTGANASFTVVTAGAGTPVRHGWQMAVTNFKKSAPLAAVGKGETRANGNLSINVDKPFNGFVMAGVLAGTGSVAYILGGYEVPTAPQAGAVLSTPKNAVPALTGLANSTTGTAMEGGGTGIPDAVMLAVTFDPL